MPKGNGGGIIVSVDSSKAFRRLGGKIVRRGEENGFYREAFGQPGKGYAGLSAGRQKDQRVDDLNALPIQLQHRLLDLRFAGQVAEDHRMSAVGDDLDQSFSEGGGV